MSEKSKKIIESIRYQEKNYSVYKNEDNGNFEIKVDRNYAKKLMTVGLEKIKNTEITLH